MVLHHHILSVLNNFIIYFSPSVERVKKIYVVSIKNENMEKVFEDNHELKEYMLEE